jgi:hypothetical protein
MYLSMESPSEQVGNTTGHIASDDATDSDVLCMATSWWVGVQRDCLDFEQIARFAVQKTSSVRHKSSADGNGKKYQHKPAVSKRMGVCDCNHDGKQDSTQRESHGCT